MTLRKNKKVPSGYTFVGHFHSATANAIGLPGGDIYISNNYLRHIKKRHNGELEQLGITALGYIRAILSNYNRIYGDKPNQKSIRPAVHFAIYNTMLSHVAIVVLNLAPNQGFWEINSAHPINIKELEKYPLLYKKRNAETASLLIP